MLVTVFNPPAHEPIWLGKFPITRKMHLTVLTSPGIVRITKYKDTLEHEGGHPINSLEGVTEIEWTGDLWVHGSITNFGTVLIEIED